MNKYKRFIFIFLFIFLASIYPVYAEANSIEVTDISIKDKSGTITVEDPIISLNEINSSISFNQKDDYVTYELTLKNTSEDKFKINSVNDNLSNENLTIEYDYEDNYIAKDETVKLTIKLTYKNKLLNAESVSISDLTVYINLLKENGETETDVLGERDDIPNPNTRDTVIYYLIFLIVALAIIIAMLILNKYRKTKNGLLLLLIAIALSFSAKTLAEEVNVVSIKFKNITIKGEVVSHTVTFDDGINTTDVQVKHGEIVTLPDEPTREGYAFDGWYTNADLKEEHRFDPENVIEDNMHLYAKWSTFVITFETNGGTLDTYTKNVKPGDAVGELPEPVKDGEEFYAWYLDPEFNTMVTSETVPTKDTKYYARYENGLKIIYNANGGKYTDNTSLENILYITGSSTVYSHTPNVSDDGSNTDNYLNGLDINDIITLPGASSLNIEVWYSTEENWDWLAIYPAGVTPTSDNFDEATISNGKLTGGQQIEISAATHVTYEVAGDTAQFYFSSDGSVNAYGYYAIVSGDTYVGNKELEEPTRDGYVFMGWYTDADCTDGNEFDIASASSGDQAYAKWTPIFKVTYNANGGSFNNNTTHETSYYHDNQIVYSKTTNINANGNSSGNYHNAQTDVVSVENAGKLNIEMWHSTSENKWVSIYPGDVDADDTNYRFATISNGKLINYNANTKGNAGHAILNTYNDTITFYINDESYYYGYYAIITINTLKMNDYVEPTKTGYRFKGWYLDPDCTDGNEFDVDAVTSDIEVYAKWETYTITFDAMGGSIDVTSKNVEPGQPVGEMPVPTMPDYAFHSWCIDEELTTCVNEETIPEGSTTYYAKYLPAIYVIYEANGGTYSDQSDEQYIPYYGIPNTTIYSHTPNINDAGVASGTYSSGMNVTDTVTIPDVDELKIEVWYSTESTSYDWLAIYPADVTPTASNYSQATISNGKLGGGSKLTKEQASYVEFTATGDTAKFYFKSDSSGNYYGYYAIITGGGYKTKSTIVEPTRDGYAFNGWYTDPECTNGNEFNSSDGVTDGMQVYAKWSPIVNIAFDANGGTYEDNTSIQEVPYYIGKVTKYSHSSNVNDDGTANGVYPSSARQTDIIKINNSPYLDIDIWYSISDYVSNSRNFVAIYPAGVDLEDSQYRGYDAASTYATISNGPLNGGTGTTKETSTHKSFSVDDDTAQFYFFSYYTPSGQYGYGYYATIKGETYITKEEIKEPTWERHTFKGWYTDPECTDGHEFDGTVTPGMTIYAKWIADYVVTLDANGGTYGNNQSSVEMDFKYGTTTKYSHTPNVDDNGETTTEYEKRKTMLDVVSIPGADSIDIEVSYSTNYNDYLLIFDKDEKIFYYNNSISGKLSGNNGNNTLYNRTYSIDDDTVQFYFKAGDYNGASYGYYATVTGIGYYSNDPYVEPTRDGYFFDGWCTNSECTGEIIDDINSVKYTSDTTYYAKWNKASYTVTYNANGGKYDNQSTTNVNTYNYGLVTKYSHTPNIDDNGDRIDNSNYLPAYSEYIDNISFGNARKLNISMLIYTSSDYYDKLAVYPKGIEPTPDNLDLATISGGNIAYSDSSGGYTGSNNSKYNYINNIYNVDDNEVTFYYKIGSSSIYYGYYAIITGYGYETTDSIIEPTREGYSFEGWYTDPACTNKFDINEYMSTDNIEVYAKWLQNYNVTFNANGGKFSNNSNTNVNEYGYRYITKKSHTPNVNDNGDNNGVYTGHIALNDTMKIAGATNLSVNAWYGTYNGAPDYFAIYDGTVTPDGQNYDLSISGKLYCEQYCSYGNSKDAAKKVHYDINGNTVNTFFFAAGMSGNYGYYIEVSGYGYDNLGNYEEPTREGYSFGGWYTNPACTGNKVDLDDITSATTLYAKWNSTYTVTYDANNGVYSDDNSAKDIVYYIGSKEQTIHSSNLNDSGYMNGSYATESKTVTYLGSDKINVKVWYSFNDDGDYLAVYPKNVIPSDSNVSSSTSGKLEGGKNTSRQYAQFKMFDVPSDEATFYLSANDTNNSYYGYYAVVSGDGVVPSADYEEPTRENYTFAGWYTNAECTDGNEIDPTTINTTMTIYAKWISYVITFDPTEGELEDNIKHISIGSFIGDMPTPTREGYSFEGWYTDTNYNERVFSITVPEGNATYYAKWKRNIVVTYNANGGEYSDNATSKNLTYKWNETVITKHSDNFDDNGNYSGYISSAVDDYIVEIPEADKLYVEIWHSTGNWSYGSILMYPNNDRLPKSTAIGGPYPDYPTASYATSLIDAKKDIIEFNTNKLGIRFGASSSIFGYYAKIHGAGYKTTGAYEEPTREGYTFDGWCLDANCENETTINALEGNAILYAKWRKNEINITYNANGGTYADNSNAKSISYTYGDITKYSHTANIDDTGTANGTYESNLAVNDIVSIPGAKSIYIDLWYSTQSSGNDLLAIYPSDITPATNNTSQAAISNGQLSGGQKTTKADATHTWTHYNGNVAQFFFKSNASNNYYGYYAIITATGYDTNEEVSEPIQSGKTFAGWYTDAACTEGNELKIYELTSDTVVYSKWQ